MQFLSLPFFYVTAQQNHYAAYIVIQARPPEGKERFEVRIYPELAEPTPYLSAKPLPAAALMYTPTPTEKRTG